MVHYLYLYVLDTMADWEYGYILAELVSGRFCKSDVNYELVLCSNSKEKIRTMGGFILQPEICLTDIQSDKGNVLILPGGDTWLDVAHVDALQCVKDLLKTDLVIAAICGATFGLASVGILNDHKHTSNDLSVLQAVCPNYSGRSLYMENPAVTDGNLITATGLAPVDFALHVFQRLDVMHKDTLKAWYNLYQTRDPKFYHDLINSLDPDSRIQFS